MALPQKTIDELSRAPVRTPGWSGSLLMFCGTLLFVSIFVYGGLRYGYLPYLDAQVKKLKDQTQSFNQQVSVEDQKNIVTFYSQLVHVRMLLDTRTAATPLVRWLEARTLPNVFYTKFSFNAANRQVVLGGETRGVPDITSQVSLLQSDPAVERVSLGNVSVSGGNFWQFDITVLLKHVLTEADVVAHSSGAASTSTAP